MFAKRWSRIVFLFVCVISSPGMAQTPSKCSADSVYHLLDFWVGDWQVYVGDTLVGTNRIVKILDDCAVEEHWRDTSGNEGMSLFYVEPQSRRWRQVWVTGQARQPGGLKEKQWLPAGAAGTVRFQGEIRLPDGRILMDRTTLSSLAGGSVRQLIEGSLDGGTAWRPTFDAVYRRR